mmetsp:Transcript_19565/g.75121  ORF Transcript_19565/g.75121 Transcript_19565/m.75121 type:complete len:299 (+) Transcript_19565:105-1001(+)
MGLLQLLLAAVQYDSGRGAQHPSDEIQDLFLRSGVDDSHVVGSCVVVVGRQKLQAEVLELHSTRLQPTEHAALQLVLRSLELHILNAGHLSQVDARQLQHVAQPVLLAREVQPKEASGSVAHCEAEDVVHEVVVQHVPVGPRVHALARPTGAEARSCSHQRLEDAHGVVVLDVYHSRALEGEHYACVVLEVGWDGAPVILEELQAAVLQSGVSSAVRRRHLGVRGVVQCTTACVLRRLIHCHCSRLGEVSHHALGDRDKVVMLHSSRRQHQAFGLHKVPLELLHLLLCDSADRLDRRN